MAFSAKRAELIAELAELRRLQMGANRKADLGGWTRAARISLLRLELAALDKSEPGSSQLRP
jgi:hypothetical protein